MDERIPDPPPTLAEAEIRFSKFLVGNGFPSSVRWILADHIALTAERTYLILAHGASEGRGEADRRYAAGLSKGLGILLNAICATATETIASVYVPLDYLDAQYHLIRPGLKLSRPTEKIPAILVSDPSKWETLGEDVQFYSKRIREILEL